MRYCSAEAERRALQLAIQSARDEIGRQVAVAIPAFSCFDVASAAIGAGGPVILYDLDPLSLSPDLESLDRALAAGARIVVVAPLYGVPVDWDAIEDLASTYGATLIEDAAQGHGATHRRRPLGSLGEISTLSFGRGKGWTGGSGGAVLFAAGESVAKRAARQRRRAARTSGPRRSSRRNGRLGRPSLYGIPQAVPGSSSARRCTILRASRHRSLGPRPPRLLATRDASSERS